MALSERRAELLTAISNDGLQIERHRVIAELIDLDYLAELFFRGGALPGSRRMFCP